jgi:hypothetical protein
MYAAYCILLNKTIFYNNKAASTGGFSFLGEFHSYLTCPAGQKQKQHG